MYTRWIRNGIGLIALMGASFSFVHAQRTPVLPQVKLPHNYYFREMYLPQLTSGPSSVDWLPDGSNVVYSMAGSLWRQRLDSPSAEQLTDGDGYDYQPDVSPDGKSVLFVRYNGNSLTVWMLDLKTLQEIQLTTGNHVDAEPRWAPNGKDVAFVSTRETGHFLIYRATVSGTSLQNITRVTPDRNSEVARYYYSPWDHAIHPCWTADGRKVIGVSNREVAHGTGDLVAIDPASGSQLLVHREETSWRAKPDVSPDGTRIVYSSYQGRNFHQLWILPVAGGYPLPLTFGEYDNTSPRWSPDGNSIAFVSNRDGDLALYTVDALYGQQRKLEIRERKYLKPRQLLRIQLTDDKGQTVSGRISVTDSRGRFHAPVAGWIHADDGIHAGQYKYESHYFHTFTGTAELDVPAERLLITASHGPAFEIAKGNVDASRPITGPLKISFKPLSFPRPGLPGVSGDLHVHMNYAGSYLNTPERLLRQASAEDLNMVFNLVVNKEQRIPDIAYAGRETLRSSDGRSALVHAQEYHSSFWGHMGILGTGKMLLPDFVGYPQTALASLFPDNVAVARKARTQGSLVGYVHPFETSEVMPSPAAGLTHELPVSAVAGLIDYYEVIGFADHRASERAWHQLLNCGFRIPAGAGTDAMADYASLRGPVGLNRVYVRGQSTMSEQEFLNGVRRGQSFVTNGPLLGISVAGKEPGESIEIPEGGASLEYTAWLRSQVPVDFFEVVWNGEVIARHMVAAPGRTADVNGKIRVKGPGWIVIRAGSAQAHPDLPDLYPFATTNPVYVETAMDKNYYSKNAAAWFRPWITQLHDAVQASGNFRTESERTEILSAIRQAADYFERIAVSGKP